MDHMSLNTSKLQIILRNGKPRAVVLGIKEYELLLEAAEESEDLAELKQIKKGKTHFRDLGAVLRGHV